MGPRTRWSRQGINRILDLIVLWVDSNGLAGQERVGLPRLLVALGLDGRRIEWHGTAQQSVIFAVGAKRFPTPIKVNVDPSNPVPNVTMAVAVTATGRCRPRR